jgi:uncharacterized protein (DUF362 family)/glycosyltransferase involved in cell wall biosynthesis
MLNNKVYIYIVENGKYPNKLSNFSPSVCYPEYKFIYDISETENIVYAAIRNCLFNLGFDKENYGKDNWNPLKEIINPGDKVLLKPNMVMHENEIPENGTDCLITHPSLIRAMLDYIVLALDGSGSIIVGDAPVQFCDFERLVDETGYDDIINFYRQKGIKIELVDFRNYRSISKNGLLHKVKNESNNDAVVVNLGNASEFNHIDAECFNRLRITNYDHSVMFDHHNQQINEYLIAKSVLEADVIINMPKPKTHRKAGVTISLKNLVGINTNKEWLPHHTEGSTEEGGDEYLVKSLLKKKRTGLIEKKDNYMVNDDKFKAKVCSCFVLCLSVLIRFLKKDSYSEGSWYGNDTIWRIILDLNKIIFYADKKGNLKNKKQKKMLIVADMIVSGEGEGPLLPNPKIAGIIAMGLNPVCFDEAISSIMGFEPSVIPSINNARNIKDYYIADENETLIESNNPKFNLKNPGEISYSDSLQFKPPMGWKGYNIKYGISIVIPYYKGKKYIDNTLNTLLNSLENSDLVYEIIIINDSPDEQISDYKYYSNNITVINNDKNYGIAYSRNIGKKAAKYEYIYFVDQDDWVHEKFFKEAQKYIGKNYDMIIFNFMDFINNNFKIHYNFLFSLYIKHIRAESLLKYGNIFKTPGQMIFRKELMIDLIETEMQGSDDYFLYIDLFSKKAGKKIKYIKSPLFIYRNHENNYSNKANFLESAKQCYDKYKIINPTVVNYEKHFLNLVSGNKCNDVLSKILIKLITF